jgi:hypothetical protein
MIAVQKSQIKKEESVRNGVRRATKKRPFGHRHGSVRAQ